MPFAGISRILRTIETFERPPSAQERRESLEAKRRLARMDFLEDAARLAEEAELKYARERLAVRYRKLVGVSPRNREAFREGLERILSGVDLKVTELIELIEPPPYVKGSGAGGSPSSD